MLFPFGNHIINPKEVECVEHKAEVVDGERLVRYVVHLKCGKQLHGVVNMLLYTTSSVMLCGMSGITGEEKALDTMKSLIEESIQEYIDSGLRSKITAKIKGSHGK